MTSRRRTFPLSSAKFGNIMIGKLIACIGMLLWAENFVSVTVSSSDIDGNWLVSETSTNIEPFDNTTAQSPPAATTNSNIPKDNIPIINGDFEMSNIAGNLTVDANSTVSIIPNWAVGGGGVQIIPGMLYKMSSFAPTGKICIHLNNPWSSENTTRGSIGTTLATNPTTGKFYTVQFDSARKPDGPTNLLPTFKVSSISGSTTNKWELKKVRYNVTDTMSQITWVRQSFIYEGTGAATSIVFQSMSEPYGAMIDNVVLLPGKHELSAAIPAAHLAMLQLVCPIITAVVVMTFHCPQLFSLL